MPMTLTCAVRAAPGGHQTVCRPLSRGASPLLSFDKARFLRIGKGSRACLSYRAARVGRAGFPPAGPIAGMCGQPTPSRRDPSPTLGQRPPTSPGCAGNRCGRNPSRFCRLPSSPFLGASTLSYSQFRMTHTSQSRIRREFCGTGTVARLLGISAERVRQLVALCKIPLAEVTAEGHRLFDLRVIVRLQRMRQRTNNVGTRRTGKMTSTGSRTTHAADERNRTVARSGSN